MCGIGDKQVNPPGFLHIKVQKIPRGIMPVKKYLQYPTITYLSYNKIRFLSTEMLKIRLCEDDVLWLPEGVEENSSVDIGKWV